MDKPKFALPSPNFNKNAKAWKPKPHFLTPSGMSLLPREKQPPPMYGTHGATVPARYLQKVVTGPEFVTQTEALHPPDKQYCEPCELELHSLEDLKRHRAQHEKCPVAGCLYKGHPSVMDKHINSLHASGLFDKFKKLSTPEEIAAWREERRKRYPTLANVLLKQKAHEQRQKRGERLDANTSRFGKMNDRKRAQSSFQNVKNQTEENKPGEITKINPKNKGNRKNKRNQKCKTREQKPKVETEVKLSDNLEEEVELCCGGIKMFRGTSQLKDYKHFNEKRKQTTNNALFDLVGMYGADDDDGTSEDSDNSGNIETRIETLKKLEIPSEHKSAQNYAEQPENYKFLETESEKRESTQSDFLNKKIVETERENREIKQSDLRETTRETLSQSNGYSDAIRKTDIHQDLKATTKNNNFNLSAIESIENVLSNQDSSDEAPEETPIQRNVPEYPVKSVDNLKSMPNEEPEKKRCKLAEQPATSRQKQFVKRKSGLDYRKGRLRKQNTMLEKLLEMDIRHERNVLLQCVRYVCEKNFFDIGQNKNMA